MKLRAFGLAAALLISPAIAFARSSFGGPTVAGIPVEFILFAIVCSASHSFIAIRFRLPPAVRW